MDFAAELAVLAAELERREWRWAVIGGVALAALGMPRTTLDIDLVRDATAQDGMVEFLECGSTLLVTAWKGASMSSSRPSEPAGTRPSGALLDLERDLPTTPRDSEVLRRLRDRRQDAAAFPDLSAFPSAAPSLARRGTSKGWEELTL